MGTDTTTRTKSTYRICIEMGRTAEHLGEIMSLGGDLEIYASSFGSVGHEDMVDALIRIQELARETLPQELIGSSWSTYKDLRGHMSHEAALVRSLVLIRIANLAEGRVSPADRRREIVGQSWEIYQSSYQSKGHEAAMQQAFLLIMSQP